MRLFDMGPIGLGTEHVESFPSYILRLSAAHGISLSRLFNELKADDGKSAVSCNPSASTSSLPWSTVSMVRPTETTHDVVSLVSHYTGRDDLRGTTFLALRQLNYRSVDLFSNAIRWCPCCFREDRDNGRPAYFRLIWSFKEVEYCHHHNVMLEDHCSHCQYKQHGQGRHFDLSKCRRCKKPLSEKPQALSIEQLSRDVCFRDLIALACEVSGDATLEYNSMASVNLLEKIFDKVWELDAEKEFCQLIPKDESLMIVTMNKPVTVKKLRRVAYRLGISFPGLLAGEAECWTPQLDPRWLSDLPENMRPPKRRESVDRDEVLARLTAVRKSVDPKCPPPLAYVARVVGISTGGLEYLHPSICKEVKQNYQLWLVEDREQKYATAATEVWQYMRSDLPGKSRKHALRTLREKTQLPKNLLREVIAEEFSTSVL